MNFAKKTYKTQSIVFGIMMALSYMLAIYSVITGIISLLNTDNSQGFEGLGNAVLFVLSIIGGIVGAVLGIVMTIKFIGTLRLYKGLKISPEEFMLKKPSRVVDLVFGILLVVAGIVCVLILEELVLKIGAAIFAVIILIFLILDSLALKKVKTELNAEGNKIEIKKESLKNV